MSALALTCRPVNRRSRSGRICLQAQYCAAIRLPAFGRVIWPAGSCFPTIFRRMPGHCLRDIRSTYWRSCWRRPTATIPRGQVRCVPPFPERLPCNHAQVWHPSLTPVDSAGTEVSTVSWQGFRCQQRDGMQRLFYDAFVRLRLLIVPRLFTGQVTDIASPVVSMTPRTLAVYSPRRCICASQWRNANIEAPPLQLTCSLRRGAVRCYDTKMKRCTRARLTPAIRPAKPFLNFSYLRSAEKASTLY